MNPNSLIIMVNKAAFSIIVRKGRIHGELGLFLDVLKLIKLDDELR